MADGFLDMDVSYIKRRHERAIAMRKKEELLLEERK